MPYKYLEHEADVGILASGKTLEEAFAEGAKALFGVMVELKGVKASDKVKVECSADDIPGLFVEWLNELVRIKDIEGSFYSKFKVNIDGKKLVGECFGEKIDLKKHNVKTEVKAATYSGLKYEQKNRKHCLRCVLDI